MWGWGGAGGTDDKGRKGAALRGKAKGGDDGATVPSLRTHFTSVRAEEARDGERKGVAEGFIASARARARTRCVGVT